MSRKKSGLNTLIKAGKAVNKISKEIERDRLRREKELNRKNADFQRQQRLLEKSLEIENRKELKDAANKRKQQLAIEKVCYEQRCEARALIKYKFIEKFLR